MDRKLTPQQELTAAKARVRAHASGLDLALEVNRRLAGSLIRTRGSPKRALRVAATTVAPLIGLVRLIGVRSHARRRR